MDNLTEKQQKRIARLAQILDEGDMALLRYLNEMEDHMENMKGVKGDKGDQGEPGTDGRDGADGKDGKDGRNGRDGRDGKDGEDGRDGNDGKDGRDGKDGSPDTPEQARDKLASLVDDERLGRESIKGIDELEKKLLDRLERFRGGSVFGARGVHLYTDSAKRGLANTLNLIAGLGITINYSHANGRNDVTISNSISGGYTVETPVGTVNGSNQVFSVTAQPVYVVADGITYFEGAGYSYAALNITMDVPPSQYIRAFRT